MTIRAIAHVMKSVIPLVPMPAAVAICGNTPTRNIIVITDMTTLGDGDIISYVISRDDLKLGVFSSGMFGGDNIW